MDFLGHMESSAVAKKSQSQGLMSSSTRLMQG